MLTKARCWVIPLCAWSELMLPRFARATASRPQLLKLVQHARWNLDDRVWLQVRSAFPELVGKRLGDVWVGLECLLGLSLAARTSAGGPGSDSAERVEASDALAPRFATGVQDDDACAHLTHAADVDTRIWVSVTMPMPGYAGVCACFREGVQGKTLPGRLELPTLRLTASCSNQLS